MPHTITASTTLCAVIGNPVGHSLSPDIHNAAFRHLGLDWIYTAFRVEDLANAIAGIRALGIRGVSITIPHKVAALPLLDSLEETAAKIGAVNTIVNTGGRLHGINTDGAGALRALTGAGHNPAGASVLILGSGGAARAIAFTIAVHAAPGAPCHSRHRARRACVPLRRHRGRHACLARAGCHDRRYSPGGSCRRPHHHQLHAPGHAPAGRCLTPA